MLLNNTTAEEDRTLNQWEGLDPQELLDIAERFDGEITNLNLDIDTKDERIEELKQDVTRLEGELESARENPTP